MAEQEETNIMRSISIAVAVVILAVISALVISSILGSSIFDDIPTTGTNTNESLGAVDNITNVTFAIISTASSAICDLDVIHNATGGEVVLGSGNYTFYTDCNLIMNGTSPYNGTTLNATYSFTYDSGTSLAGVNVTEIADDFGEFITGLLGFLGIIGIVLGVIWLIMYVAKLFSKGGLNDLGQAA